MYAKGIASAKNFDVKIFETNIDTLALQGPKSFDLMAKVFGMEAKAQRIIGTLQVDISHTCSHLDWEPPFSVEQGMKKLKQKNK